MTPRLPDRAAVVLLISLAGAAPAAAQWSGVFNANGPNDAVSALAVASPASGVPARLYVGGQFTAITTPQGSIPGAYIASWDGQSWVPGPSLNALVYSLALHPYNGVPTLFAGKSAGSPATGPLSRLTDGQWIDLPAGSEGYIFGLASYDLGQGPRLALSSPFFTPSSYIAAWNNGTLEPMGSGLISITKAFAIFDDGQGPRLYAGYGPNAEPGLSFLARFDGIEWATPPGSPRAPVNALIVFDDGTGPALYAGGDFTFVYSSTPASHIARFQNGQWSALGAGVNNSIRAMAVYDDGSGPGLYVAGDFTTAGGQPASHIARWQNGQWSSLGAGIGGSVAALQVFDDDGPGPLRPALYAAGSFTSAGGQPSLHIARWGETSPCYANCDASTTSPVLNANDFACFLNKYAAGDSYANCDGSTSPPTLTANDFQCFLNTFAAGCS